MISIYPVMDLSILLSIHLISSIYQSSIDLHTSYSPINGHICVFSIYIYTSNHLSMIYIHLQLPLPWSGRSFTALETLGWTTWNSHIRRRFPWKWPENSHGTGERDHSKRKFRNFIFQPEISRGLWKLLFGGVRDKKKRVTRRKNTKVTSEKKLLMEFHFDRKGQKSLWS